MSKAICFLSGKLYRVTLSLPKRNTHLRQIGTDNGQKSKVITNRLGRFWRSWIPIPTSVGITVLAVLQWRRIQTGGYVAKDWEISCYRAIPCRALSRVWGWVSNCYLPGPVRTYIYGLYSSLYGVNLDEMARDLTYYPSLATFFTRKLKEGVRPIDPSDCIVSPADGRVLNCGKICSCHVEQIKGVTYKIQTFLGEPSWLLYKSSEDDGGSKVECDVIKPTKDTDENDNVLVAEKQEYGRSFFSGGLDMLSSLFSVNRQIQSASEDWEMYREKLLTNPNNELYQMVVYLAPGDYHRFHSPIQWQVNFRRHFQGELLSVNPKIAGWIPELFSLNERVVYAGEWEHGFFSMTAVGATNVGSIRVHCDKTLHTNTRKWKDGVRHRDIPLNIKWQKGEEVGEFRMGSTIVLIFEAPKGYSFNTGPNQRVQVGQSLCCKGCIRQNL